MQFDQLFTSLLLYPHELADAHAWQAMQLLKQKDNSRTHTNEVDDVKDVKDENSKVFSWLSQVHYSYLVRFLVQFPQLACLICAHSTTATSTLSSTHNNVNNNKSNLSNRRNHAHMKSSTLQISRDVLALLQRFTKIVNECLQFIADYEQQLQLQISQSAESPTN